MAQCGLHHRLNEWATFFDIVVFNPVLRSYLKLAWSWLVCRSLVVFDLKK